MYENIVHRFYITDDMVHFSCSHASWREDIVPDLSPRLINRFESVTEFPILEAAPSSHGIYFDVIHVPCQYSHREIRDQQEWLNAPAGIQRR
jgi:hypothetical protein